MKICIITTGDIVSSGTIKGATGLAVAFNKKGHKTSLMLMNTANNRDRVRLECPDVKVFWFESTSALNEIKNKNRIIKKYNFDVVYVTSFGIRNFVYKIFNKKKIVSILEHSELQSSVANIAKIRYVTNLILEKFSMLFFSGHVCNSKYIYNELNKRNKKVVSLYSTYAYSSDLVNINNKLSDNLLKIYKDKKVVCYMGTLVENYGILDIIRAIKDLRKSHSNFILLVIGKGKDKDRMLQIIDKENLQDYVHIADYVSEENIYTYFSCSDAFVMPLYNTVQDWARSPSKLFMYMHFNKPIITSKIGESAEIFSNYDFYYNANEFWSMSLVIEKALFSNNNWKSKWSANEHTWDVRAIERIEWLKKKWPERL